MLQTVIREYRFGLCPTKQFLSIVQVWCPRPSPYFNPRTMKTRNHINLRKRLLICVIMLITFSAIHAFPSIVNMRFQSSVYQHGFPEVCRIFQAEKKIIACWFLQQSNPKVLQFVSESKTRRKRRSSFAGREEDKEQEETNARFNFHIYLDHMWHLNMGTTK